MLRLITCKYRPIPYRDTLLTVNGRSASMPRWRDLNHFSPYLTVEFTDGSKWEDMSKVCYDSENSNIARYRQIFQILQICVPVLRNTFVEYDHGYRLLRCVRAYVELDILASFDLQTDDTIKMGRSAAKKLQRRANVRLFL